MATVKFYLNTPKKETSSIYFRLNYGAFEIVNDKKRYIPLQYHIDETINPVYWNANKGEAKQNRKFPQYPEFNARLNDIRDTVLNLLRRIKNDGGNLDNEILRKELDLIFKKHRNQTEYRAELMSFIVHFIKTSTRSVSTKRSCNRVLKDLREFEQLKKTNLTFKKIDIDFHNNFIQYLQSKRYAPNTIGARIKVLKTFMNEAYERNLHNNTDYQKRTFANTKEDTMNVYLNEEELQSIYKLDLSKSKKLDYVF